MMKKHISGVLVFLLTALLLLTACGRKTAVLEGMLLEEEAVPEPFTELQEPEEEPEPEITESEMLLPENTTEEETIAVEPQAAANTNAEENTTTESQVIVNVAEEETVAAEPESTEEASEEPAEESGSSVQEPDEPEMVGGSDLTGGPELSEESGKTEEESGSVSERELLITVPAEYAEPGYEIGEMTRGADGSVTYRLTEGEHRELLDSVRADIQEELDTMCSSRFFPHFDSMTVNDDCTVFTVVVLDIETSRAEQTSIPRIYELGQRYAAFSGTKAENIHIDYMTKIGNTFVTRDSRWDHWTGTENW